MNRLFVRTKNNKGSTLIIVLVIVAFIAILGTTTIASAMLNYKMKLVDKGAKKSFYTAEEAVDQVYAGLGKLSMENLNLIYTDKMSTMTRQDASGSSYQMSNDDCNKELRVEFADKMLKALFQTYTWDKSNKNAVIPPTEETAIGVRTVAQILNSYIEDTTNLRVKSVGKQKLEVAASMYPNMYNYTIIIQDCAIEYKNSDGYFANVTVDINLGLPDLKIVFVDDSESQLTTFEDFAIIANTGLNVNSSKTLNISDTKVYAGATGGVKVGSNSTFNAQGKSSVVTPGALSVGADLSNTPGAVAQSTNSKFSLATNSKLWCMDIIAPENSSLGNISILGSAFVKDDLNVDGTNNMAVIDGNYVGFSYEGRITSTNVGHANSSAMMINGKGCRLSMSSITTLILGGRSYIDIDGQRSYMTGESVSLRANQEIYLVPDAFLKKKSNSSQYYSNPVVSTYTDDVNVTIPDSFFAKAWLTPQMVTTVTVNGFRYYYFDIEKQYVDDYVNAIANYNAAVDGLDVYRQTMRNLLMADITELQQQSLITSGSGAAIYSNGSLINAQLDVSGEVDSISAQTTGSNFGLGADSFKITATDLNNRFSLITKVLYEPSFYSDGSDVKGNEALTSKERAIYSSYPSTIIVDGKKINIADKTDNVFTNFINTTYLYEKTNIADYVPAGQTASSPFKVYASNKTHNGGTIYIDNINAGGHVNYTDGLIITDGNVVVRQNFNGLIIAGGTVSIDNSVTVTNTYKNMDNMLASLSSDDKTAVQKFFTAWSGKDVEEPKDPLDYNISGITYRNIVDFTNWRKSAPTIINTETPTAPEESSSAGA